MTVTNEITDFVDKNFWNQEKEFSKTYYYLDKYMMSTANCIPIEQLKFDVKENKTIWMLWLQGMGRMPALVKKSYESVKRNKPSDWDMILLTEDNLNNYIKLPDFIKEKFDNGIINRTFLSDIIRVELLSTYGGCWIDATVYCMDKIPRFMIEREMFVFKLKSVMADSVLKNSNWWISAKKDNELIQAMRAILHSYWQNESTVKNYFLFHIIMSKLIDENSTCKAIFEDIPYFNSGNAHVLFGKMHQIYNEDELEAIRTACVVQKLSNKVRYIRGDVYNYYEALLDGKLDK